jgi:hypothetical protein
VLLGLRHGRHASLLSFPLGARPRDRRDSVRPMSSPCER